MTAPFHTITRVSALSHMSPHSRRPMTFTGDSKCALALLLGRKIAFCLPGFAAEPQREPAAAAPQHRAVALSLGVGGEYSHGLEPHCVLVMRGEGTGHQG